MSLEIPAKELEKLDNFFSKYTLRQYKKGHFILFPGDNPSSVYFLVKGSIRQYDISYRGDEVVVYQFVGPTYFPMLLVVPNIPNRFFYDATTNVEIKEAPIQDVLDFLLKNPDLMMELLKRVFVSMDGMLQRIAHLMGGSSRSRVIFELLLEARKTNNGQSPITSTVLQLSESDLASRIGLTRETVNREIKKLKNAGYIEKKYRRIYLKNILDLEKQLGSRL